MYTQTHFTLNSNASSAVPTPSHVSARGIMAPIITAAFAAVMMLTPGTARAADWSEDFDDFATGSEIIGQGGWSYWDCTSSSPTAIVTDEIAPVSGPNSLRISGTQIDDDIIQQLSGYTSGFWTLTAWVFVPSDATGGRPGFILLNTFECGGGGDSNWSTELRFDTDLDVIESEPDDAQLPLKMGQWVELKIDIDLDSDWQNIYYDGDFLCGKSWTDGFSGDGALDIACVDLWSDNSPFHMYYDDLSLVFVEGSEDCLADLTGDGQVDVLDVLAFTDYIPDCDGCPADFDGDGDATMKDLVYLWECWGPCPAPSPGDLELFDEILAVDATSPEAQSLGLIVTHLYATGESVSEGDALLMTYGADIDAIEDTVFYQDIFGGDLPPDSSIIAIQPALAYDTFATIYYLEDYDHLFSLGLAMTDTSFDGGWYASPGERWERRAVDISELVDIPDRYGVRIAQITLEVDCEPKVRGYEGTIELYTSAFSGGSLQGVTVPFEFSTDPCPADLNDDGVISVLDYLILADQSGPCDGCSADFNYDDWVDNFDLAYMFESDGSCPSDHLPGTDEHFDAIAVIDVTDAETLIQGVVVSHIYATGTAVQSEMELLIAGHADIQAHDNTNLYQDPAGRDTPPESDDFAVYPRLEYDTFVTMKYLADTDDVMEEVEMDSTDLDGNWYVPAPDSQRKAVNISDETQGEYEFGVLIAQISIDLTTSVPPTVGYSGNIRLYTSTHDCGTLQGLDAPLSFNYTMGSSCPADITGDGMVDVLDLLEVLSQWGTSGSADINGDGIVDVLDMLEILSAWGAC